MKASGSVFVRTDPMLENEQTEKGAMIQIDEIYQTRNTVFSFFFGGVGVTFW